MLTREENDLLTRVGPQTPMGALMRRYWLPALFSHPGRAGRRAGACGGELPRPLGPLQDAEGEVLREQVFDDYVRIDAPAYAGDLV